MSDWKLEELAPGVFARTGARPLEPNSGILIGDGAVVVIDSGYSTAAGRELLADVRRLTDRPISTVIITHHHFDHAWGNDAFPGAEIVGHDNARQNMEADPEAYRASMTAFAATAAAWYALTPEELAAQFEQTGITPPTATFTDRMTIDLAGQRVELLHLGAAHTTGDTLVHLPDAGIVFGGDVICNHVLPNAADGDPLHWPSVLAGVSGLGVQRIVPGHGPVGGAAVVTEFQAAIERLTGEVQGALDAGAPDPRAASAHVHLDDFGDWAGRELVAGTVRRIYRALEARGRAD